MRFTISLNDEQLTELRGIIRDNNLQTDTIMHTEGNTIRMHLSLNELLIILRELRRWIIFCELKILRGANLDVWRNRFHIMRSLREAIDTSAFESV
jgi:hypothetical protein